MFVIRLFRVGKKNQPSFKIVVTDKRNPPRAGRFIEEVGFWNSLTKEKVLKKERILYWLSVGAKPSATVYNLLVSEKIVQGKKIPSHKKAKEKEKTSPAPVPSKAPVDKKAPKSKEEKPVDEKPVEKTSKKEVAEAE